MTHYSEVEGEWRWLLRRRGLPAYVGALKVCRRCEHALDVSRFSRAASRTDGLEPWCAGFTAAKRSARLERIGVEEARAESRAAGRRYRQTEEGRARAAARRAAGMARYRATDEGRRKNRARQELAYAVRRGRVVKPSACSDCGATLPARGLHGHHWRGYDAPLDVEWLCPRCHGARHRL